MSSEAALRRAFLAACEAELTALKPGNVHVHGDGHGMIVDDFRRSAAAAAPPLCRAGSTVGARIREAVAASIAVAGCNTNLGIILLAAPLIAAAERGGTLRATLTAVLDDLTVADAIDAYAAIAAANPGGIGSAAQEDVFSPPSVRLRAAMALAADRDSVARQYATGFADVFAIGVTRLKAAKRQRASPDWATTLVYLDFLSEIPDSHVARKFGLDTARSVQREAIDLRVNLPDDPAVAFPGLLAFDADLKKRGLNPGTSADLTVASLLAVRL